MVIPEVVPFSFNRNRCLNAPLQITDVGFNNDIPSRAKPIIVYQDELIPCGIYLPRLIRGMALHGISKDLFYWFDQTKGGTGPDRAEIRNDSGNIIARIPYLIRYGQDIVAIARIINMSGINQRLSKTIVHFIEGITFEHQTDIEFIFELINRDKLSIWRTFISIETIPLNKIATSYNKNWD